MSPLLQARSEALSPVFPKPRLIHFFRVLKNRIHGEESPKAQPFQVFLDCVPFDRRQSPMVLSPWPRSRDSQGLEQEG